MASGHGSRLAAAKWKLEQTGSILTAPGLHLRSSSSSRMLRGPWSASAVSSAAKQDRVIHCYCCSGCWHTHALCDVAFSCVMSLCGRVQPWARVARLGLAFVGGAAWGWLYHGSWLWTVVIGAFWLGFLFWVLPCLAFRRRLPFPAGEKRGGKGKPLRAALVRPAASAAGIAGYYCWFLQKDRGRPRNLVLRRPMPMPPGARAHKKAKVVAPQVSCPRRGPQRASASALTVACAYANCNQRTDCKNSSFYLKPVDVDKSVCRKIRKDCQRAVFCSQRQKQCCRLKVGRARVCPRRRGARTSLTLEQLGYLADTLKDDVNAPPAAVLGLFLGERVDCVRRLCTSWFKHLSPEDPEPREVHIKKVNRKTTEPVVPLDLDFARCLWEWMTLAPLKSKEPGSAEWPF